MSPQIAKTKRRSEMATPLSPEFATSNGAEFSPDRMYRYVLWRSWEPEKEHVMFIGLNGSTADEFKNDPTIRRDIGFARAWGYGGIYKLNLFGYRTIEPKVMKKALDPIGPENDVYLRYYGSLTGCRVACWGNHGSFMGRDKEVIEMFKGLPLYSFGLTKTGQPKHPLYLPKTARLEVFQ